MWKKYGDHKRNIYSFLKNTKEMITLLNKIKKCLKNLIIATQNDK